MAKMRGQFKQQPKPLELIEEAVHLLRLSPPAVFAAYYLGTAPFVLGFLFFWADMSRSYYAPDRLIPAALALTAAYIFMKTMQTVFALRLKGVITGEIHQSYGVKFLARTAIMHSIYQPWGFIALPAALLITVPFGWCFAFYQNMTVLGPGESELPLAKRKAWHQAMLWPGQNHAALGILLLFSLVVMLNLFVAAIYTPHLIRIFFGIETVFSRSGIHMANTTFLMIVAAGTYLCVDPIVKSFYTLRCYYGQSLENGEDLISELRAALQLRRQGLTVCILAVFIAFPGIAAAGRSTGSTGTSIIKAESHPPEEIEKAVNTVLTRLEYSWRLPREKQDAASEPRGFLYDLLRTLLDWAEKAADSIDRFMQWLVDFLNKLFPGGNGKSRDDSSGGLAGPILLYILIFAGAAACAVILGRLLGKKQDDEAQSSAEPSVTAADLEDEDLLASDLPENEWLALARELLEKGEVRLGLRAMYLASLAHLAAKGIISLARHKTDREYIRELASRGEVLQEVTSAFDDITGIFERAWYGMHFIEQQTLDYFSTRHREIMNDVT